MKKSLFLLAIAYCLSAIAPQAQAQYQPNFYDNILTNGTAVVTNSQTLSVTTRPITVKQGNGLALLPLFAGSSANHMTNAIFRFEVTADGTNWTTTGPLRTTNALNGVTGVRDCVFWPRTLLDNVRKIRLTTIQNYGSNTVYCTNVVVSYSNQ